MGGADDDRALEDEQIAYYRAAAGEYSEYGLDEPGDDELAAAVEEYSPRGTSSSSPAAPERGRFSY